VSRNAYRNIPDFVVAREFVARDKEGKIVATAETSWTRSEDNQHLMGAAVHVAPTHRRRGIARNLLRLVVDAAEDVGRTVLMGLSTDRVPAGEGFARRIGAKVGLVGHTNRLVLGDVDRDEIRRWIDDGPVRAPGYSLLAIDGRYPDDLAAEIVALFDVMNTAPRDDLDMEDQVTTVEQLREIEKSFFAQSGETWLLLARHDATGELVGWSQVGWLPHHADTVWQWGTGVKPEHRGHALGKWLKAKMIERIFAERPYAVDIRTHNADSNDPMLGINHALGFKPYRTDLNWQVPVATAKSYLESV
jgi:GNAT superfamily N-acetyltransferase